MEPVFDFCVEHGLMDKERAEFLCFHFEKQIIDTVALVINDGVSEIKLYSLASEHYNALLVDTADWVYDKNAKLSREYQKYFSIVALCSKSDNENCFATYNFTRLEMIRGAPQNLLGEEPVVALLPYSQFEVIAKSIML